MRDLTTKFSPFHVFLISLTVLLGFFGALLIPKAYAVGTGDRLIMIHDRGTDRGLISKGSTLRSVFKQAHIRLDAHDRVEPGLDEPLVSDHYQVNVYRARPVVIIDGTVKQLIMSAYQTPKQIAKDAGIELRDEDIANVDFSNNFVSDGASIRMTIDRASPVQLTLYGKPSTIYTQATTVNEFMKEKGIKLGEKDDMSVKPETTITSGMALNIWRNGKQTVTQEEDIAFETEKIQDANREVGFKQVNTAGLNGKKMVTYEIIMQDGREVGRSIIQSVVTKQPTKQVETVGSKSTNTFSGDFAGALARLRSCEGSYTSNTGNGYYGAYQYDIQTWGNYGGFANASLAPPSVQDEKVWQTYQRRGWSPWPSCSRSQGLQDIYR
jgi:uncharacterized protein YabE (DUF348 family)